MRRESTGEHSCLATTSTSGRSIRRHPQWWVTATSLSRPTSPACRPSRSSTRRSFRCSPKPSGVGTASPTLRISSTRTASCPCRSMGALSTTPGCTTGRRQRSRQSNGCARTPIAFPWDASRCSWPRKTASPHGTGISQRLNRRWISGPARCRADSSSTASPSRCRHACTPISTC